MICYHSDSSLVKNRGEIPAVAQLIVRDLDEVVVAALKERAARNGRSAEAEHRRILEDELVHRREAIARFAEAARVSRERVRSTADSTAIVRDARDRS